MPGNRKVRNRQIPGPTYEQKEFSVPPLSAPTIRGYDFSGSQMTDSIGHHWPIPPYEGKKKQPADVGGNFLTIKKYAWVGSTPAYAQLFAPGPAGSVRHYHGILSASPELNSPADPTAVKRVIFPPDSLLTDHEMDMRGTTAIARCKPGEPSTSLGVGLAELLKDGLPSIIGLNLLKSRKRPRKGASSEYLNYQFGLAPLISEAKGFAQGVKKFDQLLTQYERDAGRTIRRKYFFPEERSSSTANAGGLFRPSASQLRSKYALDGGTTVRERVITRRVWFSGSFTYYLPHDYYNRGKITEMSSRVNAVLGTDLSLETLWNVAPWSWAVDWFSTAGDTLSNAQDFLSKGLVMHYGYLMVHTIVQDTYSHGYPTPSGVRPRIPSLTFITESKQRRKANPFGFGVEWANLSPYQLSIAAALGLNRGR